MRKVVTNKFFISALGLLLMIVTLISMSSQHFVKGLDKTDLFSNFNSKSVLLIHPESKTIIYNKNEHEKLPVASICKLMTSLIVLEKLDAGTLNLDDKVVASSYAASMEGSQAFLDAGSEYTVKNLLKSVIVASANDSAVVLAEAISGSEQAFVTVMNDKAKNLGMTNTVYANATGLSNGMEQHSTAYDTSIILYEVGKYTLFNEDSSIWMDELIHPSGRTTELVNTNRLIKYYDKCVNGKTGYTDEAKYCLATTSENKGLKLIAVTLNSNTPSSRFKENMDLFNYGFANYENKLVLDVENPALTPVNISGGSVNQINIAPQHSYNLLLKKGEVQDIKVVYEIKKSISAPIKAGDVVGKVLILKQGKVLGEVNVVSVDSVNKQSFKDIFGKIINNWSI